MTDTTRIEFYHGMDGPCVGTVESAAVPRRGEFVNIKGKTYKVLRVTWALDWPTGIVKTMRANVDLELAK